MATSPSKEPRGVAPVRVLILSIFQEMGETFVQDVCQKVVDGKGETEIEGTQVAMDVLAGDPRLNPSWDDRIRETDALVLLVRFMDVISIDKIKAIYRRLPNEKAVPMSVFLFREEGEIDFKMSCPACGQKLWVRDTDINKRGRCPNCKKAFKLPSQSGHLKSQLMLPDAVPVLSVVRGNASSCRGAVASLLGSVAGEIPTEAPPDAETLKKATVRVQIQNGDV
ncbi:MAG: hypothetical protein JXB04_05560 [Kiritimatiellae bacterium]|nr:hypothetical protein [Kiritimatiellia bacterium]